MLFRSGALADEDTECVAGCGIAERLLADQTFSCASRSLQGKLPNIPRALRRGADLLSPSQFFNTIVEYARTALPSPIFADRPSPPQRLLLVRHQDAHPPPTRLFPRFVSTALSQAAADPDALQTTSSSSSSSTRCTFTKSTTRASTNTVRPPPLLLAELTSSQASNSRRKKRRGFSPKAEAKRSKRVERRRSRRRIFEWEYSS